LAINVRGVDAEEGASLGRTQDEGEAGRCAEDEDAASDVPGQQSAAKAGGRGTSDPHIRLVIGKLPAWA